MQPKYLNTQQEFSFLLENSTEIRRQNLGKKYYHLDQPLGIKNYIRIADLIASQIAPGSKVLDWGCGLGHMSYLLKNRGFDCVSYDVVAEGDQFPDIPLCRSIHRISSTEPTLLPFADESFDAVLSCGVLEHVDEMSSPGNEAKSLREIHRIMRTTGKLLIYQLPQKCSWQEALVRYFKLGYAHPKRYSGQEITSILAQQRFYVTQLSRFNLIPKNLTGMPKLIRKIYGKLGTIILYADTMFSRIPLINRIAGVLEVVAQKLK
jgi:SAM-dependent methyltransferase